MRRQSIYQKGNGSLRKLADAVGVARGSSWLLVGLIIVGLGVRLWGIGWGLPYLYHPDEPLGVWVSLGMLKTGDLNPHFFGYGSVFFYLQALAYVGYFLVGQVMGLFQAPMDIPDIQKVALGVGRSFMPSQIVAGRLVSVLLGGLCIVLAYYLGQRLVSRQAGVLAAAFVALSPSLTLHSQLITPNILATLSILLELAALVRIRSDSKWLDYALVGVAFGLAVASKYNTALLIIPMAVTYGLARGRLIWRTPGVYISLVVAGLTFLLVTPYALLDTTKFVEDTLFHLRYYSEASHAGMEGNSLEFYVSYLLHQDGLLGFMGLAGAVWYAPRRDRNGLILAAFAVPYVLYISTLKLRNDRTILIVLPVLFIMAADGMCTFWRYIQTRRAGWRRTVARIILVGVVIGSLAYQGWQTVQLNIRLTTPDAREYARDWIATNIPVGARLAAESYAPFLDPAERPVTYFDRLIDHAPAWYKAEGYEWLILSSGAYGRFYAMPDRYPAEIAQYEAFRDQFTLAAEFTQNGITIRILRS